MNPFTKAPLLFPLIALLSSCSVSTPRAQNPASPAQTQPHASPVSPSKKKTATPSKTAQSPSPSLKHPLKVQTASLNGTTFTALTFDRRDYTLKVIDQEAGPGSQFTSAADAGKNHLAAINGGFFNQDGSPLGLVITDGQVRGTLNSSSFLGTGVIDGKNLTLATRKNYKKSSELLQTGPRLIWPGASLTGLSAKNDRPRSLVIWDGKNHFGLVHASSATLQGLSNNLRAQPIPDFKITHALNLDGGTSSDLWISNTIPGGGISKRSFLNKNVRNYLALQKR